MKKLLLLLVCSLFYNINCYAGSLYNEEVFNKQIEPTEMKVKDYFGADKMNNPVVLSDEYLVNLYKARGYIKSMTEYTGSYFSKTTEEYNCMLGAEKELLKRFQDDVLDGSYKIVEVVDNYIRKECLSNHPIEKFTKSK